MTKKQLLNNKEISYYGLPNDVSGISIDSRKVNKGDIFFLLEKKPSVAIKYINQAINKGAAAVILSSTFNNKNIKNIIPIIKVDSVRKELSFISSRFFPNQPKTIAAITGTNGKTSVAKFTEQIWEQSGIPSASIGTLGNSKIKLDSTLTTPDPISLHKQLNQLAIRDCNNVIIEASSHGLDQHRIDNIKLSGAAFVSFSRDHLDYHKNMQQYLNTKKRLFLELIKEDSTVVMNLLGIQKRYHSFINDIQSKRLITIGKSHSTINILEVSRSIDKKINLKINIDDKSLNIETPFFALFQSINAVIAACVSSIDSRVSLIESLMDLVSLKDITGRLEFVASKDKYIDIYVDYAHTPSAMKSVLESLRLITKNNLILVFGAGGDRDKGKRKLMRDIAKYFANLVIVTDDNPRYEDPKNIRDQLMIDTDNFIEIPDRFEAIKYAITKLKRGDNLIICGKGHEDYMLYKDAKIFFSDQQAVKTILNL
jgi:UDP-N-acetylmuramoyl-L-alanyl-D-glutamate--2,6-diaminopimelate ligase